ncbi:DUF6118 family protein [Rhizobium leguminosarum]|uniref:DUF6118 family protein n=1 Tax=Rhizobium leguminosarum TaxID=384 RepID=UPI0015FC4DA9|nr:DUF6118 family protein [Rhizobium leguminosarum]MBA9031751.1 hypothetical protein [Rhizobium leguminosarum]
MAEDQYHDKSAQNGQHLEPEPFPEDQAGDPAAAFEALRVTMENLAADLTREMTTIRKGVEYTLDQMEQRGVPVDYSAELGRMNQNQTATNERLQGIEQSPTLKHGPEHYARVIERGGEGLVRTAAQVLERATSDLERIGRHLATQTKSAYDRRSQDFRMWTGIGFGLVAGALLMLILPRFLPFSADSRVAALVMGRDRVSSGRALIEAADPKQAGDISTAGWVYATNRASIDKCIADMFKTQKQQSCTLILPLVETRSGQNRS